MSDRKRKPTPHLYRKETEAKRRKYIENRAFTVMTKKEAALAAGFSPAMAKNAGSRIETPKVLSDIDSLGQALLVRIPIEVLVEKVAEGLEAKTIRIARKNGKITDVKEFPDHAAQLKYVDKIIMIHLLRQAKTTTEVTGKGGGSIQATGLNHEQIKERKQQLLRELRHELGIGHPGGDGGTQAPAEGGEAAGGV